MRKIVTTVSAFFFFLYCFIRRTIDPNNWKFNPGANLDTLMPWLHDQAWKIGRSEKTIGYYYYGSVCGHPRLRLSSVFKTSLALQTTTTPLIYTMYPFKSHPAFERIGVV